MVCLHRKRPFSLQSSWGNGDVCLERSSLLPATSCREAKVRAELNRRAVGHAPLPWEVHQDVPVNLHADFSQARR